MTDISRVHCEHLFACDDRTNDLAKHGILRCGARTLGFSGSSISTIAAVTVMTRRNCRAEAIDGRRLRRKWRHDRVRAPSRSAIDEFHKVAWRMRPCEGPPAFAPCSNFYAAYVRDPPQQARGKLHQGAVVQPEGSWMSSSREAVGRLRPRGRLSADHVAGSLIEAGPAMKPLTDCQGAGEALADPRHAYSTARIERGRPDSSGNSPAGPWLGGTSNVNGIVYHRGHRGLR